MCEYYFKVIHFMLAIRQVIKMRYAIIKIPVYDGIVALQCACNTKPYEQPLFIII